MRKIFLLILLVIIISTIAGACFLKPVCAPLKHKEKMHVWTNKMQLEYANTLLAKGLNVPGSDALLVYITKSYDLEKKELAVLCYRLGTIYMELKDYDKALAAFYKSEMLDSEADYKGQMNNLVVEAMENSGRLAQAQYELESRSSLGQKPKSEEDVVVARIGKREILSSQIDRQINKITPAMQGDFKSPQGRLKVIKDYVAGEILYDRGKKLGLDRSGKILEYVEDFKKQLVLGQLVQMEVEQNLKISPQDIELYYAANKDKYKDKQFEEVKSDVENEYRARKQDELLNQFLAKALEQQEVEILYNPGENNDKDKK